MTAADLLLQWAAFSGYYDDADPEAKTGTSYFSYAGDPTGLALTDFPELGSDGRSMTVKYSQPFPDWETALGGPGIDIPAHVLAAKAGLRDTKAFIELLQGSRAVIPRLRGRPTPGCRPCPGCGTPVSMPRRCPLTRACTCPTARSSSRTSTRTSR